MFGSILMLILIMILLLTILAKRKHNKLNMAKKKENKEEDKEEVKSSGSLVPALSGASVPKTPTSDSEQIIKILAMINLMSSREKKAKYKSGTIINNHVQPIILSSDEKFEKHYLNFGAGHVMGFPSKMLPYLIEALQSLYSKNGLEHFGNKADFEAYNADLESKNVPEYFDLSDVPMDGCGNPNCKSCSSGTCNSSSRSDAQEKVEDFFMDNMDAIKAMKAEDMMEVLDKLEDMADTASEAQEIVEKHNLTREQQMELKKATDEKILDHLKEVEAKLNGKVADKNKKVDFEYIKSVYEKHGQQAATEELMRLKPEEREAMMGDLLKLVQKK